MGRVFGFLLVAWLTAASAMAQDLTALARIDPDRSGVTADGAALILRLGLSQPVPWRAFTLTSPPRLVVEFREVDWRGVEPASLIATDRVAGLRTGAVQPGWSRLVLALETPFTVARAGLATGREDGGADLTLQLDPATAEEMAAASGAPEGALWSAPVAIPPEPRGTGEITVVLDPGHGGVDPGAEHGGITEAGLMLIFALELEEAFLRAGGFRVALTRREDVFVSLDGRVTAARAAGADLFLSLHADAVAEGRATGATVYTLSDTASDEAAAALAERHDRADLLAGVDLKGQDDVIAGVLMDLARLDTQPRSEALADALVAGLRDGVGGLHRRPRLSAGFSVLRAPDIPSALIELGFLSTEEDRARLTSPEWRGRAASDIVRAVQGWAAADAVRAGLIRQ